MNFRRLIAVFYGLLLSGLAVGAVLLLLETQAQYRQLKQTEVETRQQLAAAQSRLDEQNRVLNRLRTDPEFVEKVIRRRMSYARPGETIFRFED